MLSIRASNGYALTDEQIVRVAPAIFATEKGAKLSDRYAFFPTTDTLTAMRGAGFFPVSVQQTSSRAVDRRLSAVHLIRFRQADELQLKNINDSALEICVLNSHNRRTLDDVFAGYFRLVCLNGLIVADATLPDTRFATRHVGKTPDMVVAGAMRVVAEAVTSKAQIEAWRSVELDIEQRLNFAEAAARLRFKSDMAVSPATLQNPIRWSDSSNDLWTVFNRVQEALTTRSVAYVNAHGRTRHTRKVRSIDADLTLNRGLWQLAADTYETLH